MNPSRNHTPEQVAKNLYTYAHRHADGNNLYRIFYYDCVPFDKKVRNPISKKAIDFKKTAQHNFRIAFFEELKKKRKVALRLEAIKDSRNWSLRPGLTKELIEGRLKISELEDDDVTYDLRQKARYENWC